MHRIDTPTAQKDKFGAGKNGFTRGNPQTGTPATDLDDDYFDMLQEELAGVVEATGVNLEKSKHNQLLTALKALLLSRAHPFADIKADGAAAIAEALSNLGLDTALAAKQPLSTQLTYFANHSDTEILQYLGVPSVISAAISSLVDSSPAALDTLNELAEALGNDPNFSTTVLNKLAGKQPLDATLTGLSGKNDAGLRAYLSLKSAATRDVGSLNGQLPGMDLFASTIAGTGEKAIPDSSTGTGMFILKWGAIAAPTTSQDITTLFQTPFPNKCLRVFATADYEPGTGNAMYIAVNNSTLQRDRFVARFAGAANYTSGVYFALGY